MHTVSSPLEKMTEGRVVLRFAAGTTRRAERDEARGLELSSVAARAKNPRPSDSRRASHLDVGEPSVELGRDAELVLDGERDASCWEPSRSVVS